jgi:hypothetical protein
MQGYTNSNRGTLKTIVIFLLILFIAYLPVSTFLFFIKNDAFSGYFPPKFFMSESIHSGYLPLWNPYINFGIPQYADMSAGYWSPITWLIASTVGYNGYTFTVEILLYIFIGGLGMYALTGYWNLQNKIKLIAGVAYMCCGYNVGHMQHFNWLSGAAFLPWCMWGYLLLHKNPSLKNLLQCSLLFYLFLSSAHPGLVIGALYFFTGIALFLFMRNERKLSFVKNLRTSGTKNLLLLAILAVLSTGMIIGYLDILPYFSRGQKVLLHDSLKNPTSPQSWISFLLPWSITKNDSFFATDISMRNIYIGLTLAMFFFLSLFQKKDSWQKFLMITGGLFLLLSGGGIFKTIAYKIIPLIGYVRLDGEFMIFSLLCFILLAAIQLNSCSISNMNFKGKIVWVYYGLETILGVSIFIGLFHATRSHQSFIYHVHGILSQNSIAGKLKAGIDAITFYDTFWLQGIIQILILWGIKWSLKTADYKILAMISLVDICLATLLNLPFTGVGKASVSQVQAVLNRSPHGIVIPALQPINMIDTLNSVEKGLVGDWSMYNKQIGTTAAVPYPILLKNTIQYFDTIQADTSASLMKKNFIFTAGGLQKSSDRSINNIHIIFFKPHKVKLTVAVPDSGMLIYQQNLYPHWFYNDGIGKKEVLPYGISFFCAPLIRGKNEIEFSFEPVKVKAGMLVTLSSFIIIVLLLLLLNPNPVGTNKQVRSS